MAELRERNENDDPSDDRTLRRAHRDHDRRSARGVARRESQAHGRGARHPAVSRRVRPGRRDLRRLRRLGADLDGGPQVDEVRSAAKRRRRDDLLDHQPVGLHRRVSEGRAAERHHHVARRARLSPLPDDRHAAAARGTDAMRRSALGFAAFVVGCGVTRVLSAAPRQPTGYCSRRARRRRRGSRRSSSASRSGRASSSASRRTRSTPTRSRRVGFYGEIGLAYRSPYFLDPFLFVGHGTLASGESVLPAGPWGDGGTVEQSLGAWVISPGVTSDLWRFRPRLGIGLAVVQQSFSFLGEESSSSQLPIVTVLGLGFNALDDGRFRLDVEARGVFASGADVTFMTLDAVLRGDWIRFDLD